MDLNLRKQFFDMMEKIANAHNLLQITYPSFVLRQGFKTKYQCADYVYSMVATLESNVGSSYKLKIINMVCVFDYNYNFLNFQSCEISSTECFYNTIDLLSR